MLAVGEEAPDFEAPTGGGATIRLSDLRGRPVLLYFYPKAGSLGCTRESREFARAYPVFHERGVEIVGVSVDRPDALRRFADECELPFPLVSDTDRSISRRYGVLGAFGYARRVTFLVGGDGRVQDAIATPLPGPHVRRSLERLLAGEKPRG